MLVSLPSFPLHAAGVGRRTNAVVPIAISMPEAPNIVGQPEPYLVKSLNDYRKGIRKHDMMTIVVQPLTDQDVADLAAYYAAIEVSVKPP